jgi:SEC-C motif-containing protein
MSQALTMRSCPCGSGRPLAACCGVYLENQAEPPTAEALMRSRYTAFVLRHAEYLLATWDPTNRPKRLDLAQDRTEWLGLEILRTESGSEEDSDGRVEFIARFRSQGMEQALHEDSRFRKQAGRWFYVDGETKRTRSSTARDSSTAPRSVGRNDPCPCGSGLKFKRCCGR